MQSQHLNLNHYKIHACKFVLLNEKKRAENARVNGPLSKYTLSIISFRKELLSL